jgi:hypothetical protein
MTVYKTLTALLNATERLASVLDDSVIFDFSAEGSRYRRQVENLEWQLEEAACVDADSARTRLLESWERAKAGVLA